MTTRARDGTVRAREVAHTADVGFEVEAPTLATLFEHAGLTLEALMVDLTTDAPSASIAITIEADTREELLHDWLQELLVRYQVDGFVACELAVDLVDDRHVRGSATGERYDPARHRAHEEVKGVTYHQLAVRPTTGGWAARVILDV